VIGFIKFVVRRRVKTDVAQSHGSTRLRRRNRGVRRMFAWRGANLTPTMLVFSRHVPLRRHSLKLLIRPRPNCGYCRSRPLCPQTRAFK